TPTSTSASRAGSERGSTPARPTVGSATNSPPTRRPPPATARSSFTCTRTTATSPFVALHQTERNHPHDRRSAPEARDPRTRPEEVLRQAARAPRRGRRRGPGQHLRTARFQRRGKDHPRENPGH